MHVIPTLIIGAGVAGASLGCALAERGKGQGVTIADVDVFGRYGSSELNGGGVRCTFAEAVNVRLSLRSTHYYLQHAKTLDFRQRGYLWMYDEALWQAAREFLPAIRAFGLPVEELDRAALRERYPILADVTDLAGATLTPFDGRLSPHRLRMHYLNHAQAGGVELLDRWQVVAIEGEASPYRVTFRRVSPRRIRKLLTSALPAVGAVGAEETLTVEAHRIINAAGPWARQVSRLYGRELPVTPLPRQVFLLAHPDVNLEPLPFFIDYPQDIYFRHYERDRKPCTLVSWSDPAEPQRVDFSMHGEAYYRRHVEPRIVKRIAAIAEAHIVGSWVGHYELTPDKGAVVGAVPGREGLFNYNGLSAHGVMQSRALGESMASLLIDGRWLDDLSLEALAEARFERGGSAVERMYV